MNVQPRELAKHYRDVKNRLMGPMRVNPPPKPVLIEQPVDPDPAIVLNQGVIGWSFWPYHYVSVKPITFDDTRIMIHGVIRAVCDFYGVTPAELSSACRTRQLIIPRHVAMYLAREMTPKSLPAIGRALGGRDHTTVLHAHRKIKDMRQKDEVLNRDIDTIRASVK
jgi:hypothetical protein